MDERYIKAQCQNCGKIYKVKNPESTKRYRCKNCDNPIIVEPILHEASNEKETESTSLHRLKIKKQIPIKSILTPTSLIGIISFVIFALLFRQLSEFFNYSKEFSIFIGVVSFIISFVLFYLLFNYYRSKKSSLQKLISSIAFLFISFSITCFIVQKRINEISNDYNAGLVYFNQGDWINSKSKFNSVKKRANFFKNSSILLDSTLRIIKTLKADSCIYMADQYISFKEYIKALKLADSAKTYNISNLEINRVYYTASKYLIDNAQREYWQKNYNYANSNAEIGIYYLQKIKLNNYNNINRYISKAKNICDNSLYQLNLIKKLEEEKEKWELSFNNTKRIKNILSDYVSENFKSGGWGVIENITYFVKEDINFVIYLDWRNIWRQSMRSEIKNEIEKEIKQKFISFNKGNKKYYFIFKKLN